MRLLAKELFFYLFKLASFCTDARIEEAYLRKSYRAEFKWGLQTWLSTLQRSSFFRHHFSKSTLNSALFPPLLCVGRMRVDLTMSVRGWAYAWLRHHGLPQLLGLPPATSMLSSNSLVNTNTTTASSDSVRTFRLLRTRASLNLFFKFFRFRHVLHVIVKPVGATDSDNDDDDEWLELFHTEGLWSEAEQIKKEKTTCPTSEDRVETSNLQIHSFSSSLQSCMWASKTLHPRSGRHLLQKKKRKMTVETVETVVAAAPYAGADWPQAAIVSVGQPISARWLWRRRYSNMTPPFTKWKTFPGAPHQELSNDAKFERFRQC